MHLASNDTLGVDNLTFQLLLCSKCPSCLLEGGQCRSSQHSCPCLWQLLEHNALGWAVDTHRKVLLRGRGLEVQDEHAYALRARGPVLHGRHLPRVPPWEDKQAPLRL